MCPFDANAPPARAPQHIEYAKTKSYATLRREDPDFVPPTSIHVKNAPNGKLASAAAGANGAGEKRQRDDRMDEDAREVKRERTDKDSDDDEEMEIEDDEDGARPSGSANGA